MIIFLSILLGIITFTLFMTPWKFVYWEKKNVPCGQVMPLLGDMYEVILGLSSLSGILVKLYNNVPSDHRYVGGYLCQIPILVLRTPEIIKQICITDSDHFMDHGNLILNSSNDLWQNALFSVKGQEWKEPRHFLESIFKGNIVKRTFPQVERHIQNFVGFIAENNQDVIIEVEAKDVMLRILNDIASEFSLGMEIDSFRDPYNIVFNVGKKTCDLSIHFKKLVMLTYTMWSSIPKMFGVSLFKEGNYFFLKTVRDTIRMRQEKGIKKDDMIGLLLDVREDQLKARAEKGETGKDVWVLTDEEIASHVFSLHFGLIDSAATVMSFLAWELAMAPKIQQKLWKECDSTPSEDREVTYQDIVDMKYIDMVICEALRKWPGAISTDRMTTKPYTIEPELPHEKPVHLDIGDKILLPIYAIHRDPKYYENPDEFDPERFSPTNKQKN